MRTAKQKQLLVSHFLDLKETYMVEGKTAFNKKFNSIKGLGRSKDYYYLLLRRINLSSFSNNFFYVIKKAGSLRGRLKFFYSFSFL